MCTYSANLKTCCFTQNIFHFSLIKEQLSALKLRSQIMCKYIFVVLKLKRWKNTTNRKKPFMLQFIKNTKVCYDKNEANSKHVHANYCSIMRLVQNYIIQ